MSEKHDIIERGVQAEQLIKNKSYATVMNYLVDEAISTWVTTKLEQKELREGAWHRYQAIVAVQGITVLDYCNGTRAKSSKQKQIAELN